MLSKIDAPFEVKAADGEGNFEGYAAVFNNVDNGDDIILPRAFTKVRTGRNGRLKLALHHNLRQLLGNAEFQQDDHGLRVKGRINLNVSYARDAYELMKDGTLDSMSIGYTTITAAYEEREGRTIRIIKEAELWEASVVSFGMNAEAGIDSVKSDIRVFEQALRDRMGLSQKEAAAVASLGYPALHRDGDKAATVIVEELKRVSQSFEQHFGAFQ